MQRSDSRFLSHRGLEFYKTFNYKVYQALEARFLSKKWRFFSDPIKIREIAMESETSFTIINARSIHISWSCLRQADVLLGSVR